MAASGAQTIQLYYSTTSGTAPVAGNLASGEIALNITDGKLYYKDNGGTVQLLASKAAASGSFSDITASGNVTLSGGTANGVAYLNGSKVLTTGSALTFDGTYFGVGSGNSSMKVGADGANNFQIFNGALTPDGTNFALEQNYLGTNTVLNAASGGQLLFRIGNSNNAVLTSTGLGIGTSSPGYKLDVAGNQEQQARFTRTGTTTGASYANFANSGGSLYIGTEDSTGSRISGSGLAYAGSISTATATALTFGTNNVNRMTIDTSGNLGLGVTPSAWGTVVGLQVQNANISSIGGGSNNSNFGSNWYYDGSNFRYIGSAAATNLKHLNGAFAFLTAPSGTAGNAITFTQAMTLDASGNLLVGGTSNAVGARAIFENASGNQIGLRYSSVATYYNSVDSSGNLIWTKDGTERARITSDGYFKASNTGTYYNSTGTYHEWSNSVADYTGIIRNTNATTPYGIDIFYASAAPNGTGSQFIYCEDSTALRMSVRSNGGIANYSANNVNLSDRREKTNFAPAKSYLETICAIPVQTFNYIDQSEEDPGLTLGVVAQDVQAVAPELVMESNWAKDGEEPKMRLSIYQTDLQYALMKALQELKAQNDELRARVSALEAK